MLKSTEPAVDGLILIDTGSTDGTAAIARELWPKEKYFYAEPYLEANDAQGRLADFSMARNRYLELADGKCDWVLSLDADDELKTPAAIRRASYLTQFDAFSLWIQDGPHRWMTHRMWKADRGLRYEGRCHEYPKWSADIKDTHLDHSLIIHHGADTPGHENNNTRNQRMLELEWAEKQSPRCAFYLANTHRDGKRWKEAAYWYGMRISMGPEPFRDEWLFAHLYCGRAIVALKENDLAREAFEAGRKAAPDWCEFTNELAWLEYNQGNYREAIALAVQCVNQPEPPTPLWREPASYRDAPARIISWSYEHMGDIGMASAWSSIAWSLIGKPDKEWEERGQRLAQKVMEITKPKEKKRIALHRPGAIGDILMTLNLIPTLKAKYPEHEIDYFCAIEYGEEEALGNIIKAAGCAYVNTLTTGVYDHEFELIGYPLREGYPEKPMRKHLLHYFAEELGLSTPPQHGYSQWELPRVNLPKPPAPLKTGPYATLQRHAGWSKYKEWPSERWDEVLRDLNRSGIPVFEIDEKQGLPLSTVIALIANARMHIGVDSFGNHLTHIFQVPGVILWGSTQWNAAGYPHNVNISTGIACQPCFRETHPNSLHPRPPCINMKENGVHSCMDAITVDEVIEAATSLWTQSIAA
jgi:ADP-heptose:LPS heptosyltransferase